MFHLLRKQLMSVGGLNSPGCRLQPCVQLLIAQQLIDGRGQLTGGKVVRIQLHSVARLVEALGVVESRKKHKKYKFCNEKIENFNTYWSAKSGTTMQGFP